MRNNIAEEAERARRVQIAEEARMIARQEILHVLSELRDDLNMTGLPADGRAADRLDRAADRLKARMGGAELEDGRG